MMAMRAGCPNALAILASSFCFLLKRSVLVAPIGVFQLQYYDKDNQRQILPYFFNRKWLPEMEVE
jgi:hypothetical protein